jgi:hypothetical protein
MTCSGWDGIGPGKVARMESNKNGNHRIYSCSCCGIDVIGENRGLEMTLAGRRLKIPLCKSCLSYFLLAGNAKEVTAPNDKK